MNITAAVHKFSISLRASSNLQAPRTTWSKPYSEDTQILGATEHNLVVIWSPVFVQTCVICDTKRLADRVSEEEMKLIQAFLFKTCNYTYSNGVSKTRNA
jgi:hypothetical protein